MHQQVANVLENKFSGIAEAQPELLAHHYTEAGLPLQAIPLWLKAGQLASQKNAATEAIAHLSNGIDLLQYMGSDKERRNTELDFLLILGTSYVLTLGYPHPKVRETFNRAREKLPSLWK